MATCSVIGLGFLGSRIIGELAYCGKKVKVFDHDPAKREAFPHVFKNNIEELERKGLIERCTKTIDNVLVCDTMAEAAVGVEWIFEAIIDNLEIKKNVFGDLTKNCNSATILGTNTLSLKLDHISEDALFTERIIGIRFFYPVFSVPIVECFYSHNTSQETINRVKSFFESIQKSIIIRNESVPPRNLTEIAVQRYEDVQRQKVIAIGRQHNLAAINAMSSTGHGQATEDTTVIAPSADSTPATHDDGNSTEEEPSNNSNPSNIDCVICLDNAIDCVFIPCGHMWVCNVCAKRLTSQGQHCPACRRPIEDVIMVFKP
eukprot:gene14004-15462_t